MRAAIMVLATLFRSVVMARLTQHSLLTDCETQWLAANSNAPARQRAGIHRMRRKVDCQDFVQVHDVMPNRSPIEVHSALASRFSGRSIVEIGTQSGDSMLC